MRRAAVALLAVVLAVSGCASARDKALRGSLLTVKTASAGFVAWDLQHQDAIVEHADNYDAAMSTIVAYYDRRAHVEHARDLAFAIVAAAALDSSVPLDQVLSTVQELVRAIREVKGDLEEVP